ncbi:hypothetical protein J0X15_17975 [Roseibium sp. CAU 1637]|uniref:Uncharacterized protein n=1 Tax=Roseibium limicola TaxID=2816037 RepID=A0A939JA71_9HYPH|nr:hypothetical protein [Roseibium limicola]MBO0347121.1 hypothetical protein [Roseibium limicola]
MSKHFACFAVATLCGLSTAMAHPDAIAHAHPHEAVSLTSPATLVVALIGLAIGGAFAYVRLSKGK